MKSFWENLEKPIYALAPMAGVADSAFRQICKEFGADALYSEMASAAALTYAPEKTLEMLVSDKKELPYIIQLFGSNPEHFAQAVILLTSRKLFSKFQIANYQLPQGIDINFGCPVKKMQKQGAGAVLMNNLKLSREIIKSVIDNTDLPVSIKIRAGAGAVDALKFLDNVRDLNIAAVMIHGRTLKQGFSGEVDFKIIKKAREYFGGIILANGGVMNAENAREMLEKTGADGIGIARGALGKPWIFKEVKSYKVHKVCKVRGRDEIFKIALRHAKLAEKLRGEVGIREMRKHLCWYAAGLQNASELRHKLVKAKSLKEIREILK